MAKNLKCLLVNMTGLEPFNRCKYCERRIQECFGLQFFVISFAIIILLIITFFITDLPALVLDMMITVTILVALLSYLASKETNEIVLNNVLLSQLNKELEEKVRLRTEELQRSNEELIKLDQMKNEFIGVINHELKTPITAVLSGLEVIKMHGTDKFDESQKKLLSIMENSGRDMLKLANNLLDLSKIESGKIVIYPEHFPLINMLEEVVQSLKPEAEKKNVKIKTKIDEAISTIHADSVRLKQVLFNLIDNAVKYTGEDSTVNITASTAGKNIKIEVKDSGIGIKKENIGNIFDKFAKRAAGYKGTGLGLYISKSFIEAHNGKIEVESEFGKGATFRILIPKLQTT